MSTLCTQNGCFFEKLEEFNLTSGDNWNSTLKGWSSISLVMESPKPISNMLYFFKFYQHAAGLQNSKELDLLNGEATSGGNDETFLSTTFRDCAKTQ